MEVIPQQETSATVLGAVRACANTATADIPCTLGINYSPWYHVFAGDDPESTVNETAELDLYRTNLVGLQTAIAAANVEVQAHVKVGVVMLDSEKFSWATWSSQARIDAITRKNELVYNVTRKVFPNTDVRIAFYDRGAVHWRPELNKTECPTPIASLPPGWCVRTGFSFQERFETSSPFTISLVRIVQSQVSHHQW